MNSIVWGKGRESTSTESEKREANVCKSGHGIAPCTPRLSPESPPQGKLNNVLFALQDNEDGSINSYKQRSKSGTRG